MSDPHPLQPGDRAPDLSDHNFSNEADRRDQRVAGSNYHGNYPSAAQDRPEGGPLWKCGQATPNEFLSAPFNVISMDGDNTGYPAETHEIDIDSYGDCYDTTAPARTRDVTSVWHLDTDHDGKVN
jgi:hypothetical protein